MRKLKVFRWPTWGNPQMERIMAAYSKAEVVRKHDLDAFTKERISDVRNEACLAVALRKPGATFERGLYSGAALDYKEVPE